MMSLTKTELSKAIIKSLKIDSNPFNYEAINEAIDLVPVERYMEFYKQILKVDTYGNGIKAVLEISEMFKNEKTDNILVGTHEQSKAMYNKFYHECCTMLDYTQKNRNKIPNDREFFKNTPYGELKRTDGSMAYSKQELYVLNALGGGEWLLDIRLALSSKEIIDKIEKIIKEAVLTKYNYQSQIESKRVQNLIGGIKK
jgi:hypothetical protein